MKISLFVKFFINDLANLNLGQESQRFSLGQVLKFLIQEFKGIQREFRGHNTYLVLRLGFGPGFCFRRLRLSALSSPSIKLSPPRGLPVCSCLRRRLTSRSAICPLINLPQSSTSSSKGDTLTSRSSRPRVCAAALLQGHSPGRSTSSARTGFISMYLAAAKRYLSSIV